MARFRRSLILLLMALPLSSCSSRGPTEPISVAQCAAWIVLGATPLILLELGKVFRQSSTPPLQTSTGYSVS